MRLTFERGGYYDNKAACHLSFPINTTYQMLFPSADPLVHPDLHCRSFKIEFAPNLLGASMLQI